MIDPISEADLQAYVDDQLDVARRIEVTHHLARDPATAARVMADLNARDALRFTFGTATLPPPKPGVLAAARRLENSLSWGRVAHRIRRVAVVAILIGAGWFAHSRTGLLDVAESSASTTPPIFVEDARRAHQVALTRSRMASQPEIARYDAAEILAQTSISVPKLPASWRVRDAQVFPSRLGESVEVSIDGEGLGRLSLFAVRSPVFGVIAPTISRSANVVTAYWQSGELAFALTGAASLPDASLENAAAGLEADAR